MEAIETIRSIEESASLPRGKGDGIAGYARSGFRFDPDMCMFGLCRMTRD